MSLLENLAISGLKRILHKLEDKNIPLAEVKELEPEPEVIKAQPEVVIKCNKRKEPHYNDQFINGSTFNQKWGNDGFNYW